MTMMLDAPTTTRKEKVMLERKIVAATAEPETTTAAELPVVEQVPTVVVIDDIDLEQSVEVVVDTTAEGVSEPSLPDPDSDDDDAFPVTKPRTRGLPMVAFKPSQKDMTDDDDAVPYAPPMSSNRFFDDDEDEWRDLGIDRAQTVVRKETSEEMHERWIEEAKQAEAEAPIREAEEKARKEKEAKEKADAKAKEEARIEKRGSRRMLGKILLGVGTLAMACGAAVPFWPGM